MPLVTRIRERLCAAFGAPVVLFRACGWRTARPYLYVFVLHWQAQSMAVLKVLMSCCEPLAASLQPQRRGILAKPRNLDRSHVNYTLLRLQITSCAKPTFCKFFDSIFFSLVEARDRSFGHFWDFCKNSHKGTFKMRNEFK